MKIVWGLWIFLQSRGSEAKITDGTRKNESIWIRAKNYGWGGEIRLVLTPSNLEIILPHSSCRGKRQSHGVMGGMLDNAFLWAHKNKRMQLY